MTNIPKYCLTAIFFAIAFTVCLLASVCYLSWRGRSSPDQPHVGFRRRADSLAPPAGAIGSADFPVSHRWTTGLAVNRSGDKIWLTLIKNQLILISPESISCWECYPITLSSMNRLQVVTTRKSDNIFFLSDHHATDSRRHAYFPGGKRADRFYSLWFQAKKWSTHCRQLLFSVWLRFCDQNEFSFELLDYDREAIVREFNVMKEWLNKVEGQGLSRKWWSTLI